MAVTLRPAPETKPETDIETETERAPRPPAGSPPPDGAPPPVGRGRPGRTRAERPLTPLVALAAGTTAALGGILFYIMLGVFGEVVPPMAVAGVVAILAGAAIALTRRRWTPLLGSLVALLLGALLIVPAATEIGHALASPNDPMFRVLSLLFPCLGVAFLAGIGATAQNYRRPAVAGTPRWVAPVLIALVGAIGGANVVAAIPQRGAAGSVSPDVLATLPAVTTRHFAFVEPELRVRAGELVALRLDNADQAPHSFDVDDLGVHAPIPVGQSGMALFRPTRPGTYLFYCAPHFDKASGEGMKGTLIVE